MKVIDDFLPNFKALKTLVMGHHFPWNYNDSILPPDHAGYKPLPQFIHYFLYENGEPGPYYSHIRDCLNYFEGRPLRVKANLTMHNGDGGYHIDIPNCTTAILYMNTCEGYTKFKDGSIIDSIENRMVIFDSNLEHSGFTNTDGKRRVVINFNYESN